MKNGKNKVKNIKLIFKCILIHRFKIKYHPDDSVKRKEEQTIALKVSISNTNFIYLKALFLNIMFIYIFTYRND